MNGDVLALHKSVLAGSTIDGPVVALLAGPTDYHTWVNSLVEIDRAIGGFGVHNIAKPENFGGELPIGVGTYAEGDREMFRGLQYCSMMFIRQFNTFDTRACTLYACQHLESIAKLILRQNKTPGSQRTPLGRAIPKLRSTPAMQDEALARFVNASEFCVPVLNAAKHDFGRARISTSRGSSLASTSHLFSFEDSVVTYFACRFIAAPTLWRTYSLWSLPDSMAAVPTLAPEEWEVLHRLESYNIRRWNPDLVRDGFSSKDPDVLNLGEP